MCYTIGLMAAETSHKPEAAVGHAADQHLSNRRQVLNQRLERWAKWFVGGLGVRIAGLLTLGVPVIGVPLVVAGTAAEVVGAVGITGNMLKRLKKENR